MDKNVKAYSLEADTTIETTLDGTMSIQELYELYIADLGGGHSNILYGLFSTTEELERCRMSNAKAPFVGGPFDGVWLKDNDGVLEVVAQ